MSEGWPCRKWGPAGTMCVRQAWVSRGTEVQETKVVARNDELSEDDYRRAACTSP